jgi:hypothetical protein
MEDLKNDQNKPQNVRRHAVARVIEGLALLVMNQLFAQHTGSETP